jgi:hypothetical protein
MQKDQKYKYMMTDKSQSDKKIQGGPGGYPGRGKKILFGREGKKNIIRAGAKKNSGVNENTTHKKAYVQ